MNLAFREVGILRYVWRRILWRIRPPKELMLHTGVSFPLPRRKFFASDVFVTQGNVDWNAEYILATWLKQKSPGRRGLKNSYKPTDTGAARPAPRGRESVPGHLTMRVDFQRRIPALSALGSPA